MGRNKHGYGGHKYVAKNAQAEQGNEGEEPGSSRRKRDRGWAKRAIHAPVFDDAEAAAAAEFAAAAAAAEEASPCMDPFAWVGGPAMQCAEAPVGFDGNMNPLAAFPDESGFAACMGLSPHCPEGFPMGFNGAHPLIGDMNPNGAHPLIAEMNPEMVNPEVVNPELCFPMEDVWMPLNFEGIEFCFPGVDWPPYEAIHAPLDQLDHECAEEEMLRALPLGQSVLFDSHGEDMGCDTEGMLPPVDVDDEHICTALLDYLTEGIEKRPRKRRPLRWEDVEFLMAAQQAACDGAGEPTAATGSTATGSDNTALSDISDDERSAEARGASQSARPRSSTHSTGIELECAMTAASSSASAACSSASAACSSASAACSSALADGAQLERTGSITPPSPTAANRRNSGYTTAMLRNIPNKYTREMLVEQLNKHFKGQFDFVYLPIDFKNKCNVGYGFINFRSTQSHDRFVELFDGVDVSKCLPGLNSKKVAEVKPARVQGIEENVSRLQKSALMNDLHHNPQWMPLILDAAGMVKDFPKPDGSDASGSKERGKQSNGGRAQGSESSGAAQARRRQSQGGRSDDWMRHR